MEAKICSLVALFLVATLAGVPLTTDANNTQVWIGPDGEPLPFQTHEEVMDFLRTARVVKVEDIPVGVTEPRKVLLEKNGVQVNSCFKTVNIHRDVHILFLPEPNRRLHWRDCCMFECAAYELSRMLGLDNILPVVKRKIEKEKGILQLWLEDALMERRRAKEGLEPPDRQRHARQMDILRVFDALVHNDDRNPTNILYDPEWKLWMLDHTRCFPRVSDLPKSIEVTRCEQSLWQRLNQLDEDEVKERLKPYLKKKELKALLKRHRKLVSHIQELIAERGEHAVIYSLD
jgi:hypothetical protein